METMIEKFGVKKIAIVVGIVIVILILLLFFLKKSSSNGNYLFKCNKIIMLDNNDSVSNDIIFYKNNSDYNVNIHYDYKFARNYSLKNPNLLDDYVVKNIDNKIIDIFKNGYEYVDFSYEFDDKNNIFKYDINFVVNEENQSLFASDFGFDLYYASVDDIKANFEKGGYTCSN